MTRPRYCAIASLASDSPGEVMPKSSHVLAALKRDGWHEIRRSGSAPMDKPLTRRNGSAVRVEPVQHERDGGHVDERLGRGHGRLVVVAEPAVAAKPGEGPLDAPQRLERDEPVGSFGTSPDVDRDAEFGTAGAARPA